MTFKNIQLFLYLDLTTNIGRKTQKLYLYLERINPMDHLSSNISRPHFE